MKNTVVCCMLMLAMTSFAADLQFYLGEGHRYDAKIATPASVIGFEPGEWHISHDRLVTYFRTVASQSDRAQLNQIGFTHERRPLLQMIISSPENLARLEEIRQQRLAYIRGEKVEEALPVVVWLGYSVHGNEASGSNAAPIVAWHLLAAEGIDALLKNTIIILEPSLNPDGLNRFASWVNSHRGKNLVADEIHREHQEVWPRGRTNHYWFDLNRDWLLTRHPESQARISVFHQWMPNILGDFHEMGTDSTFFFQPGIPSRQNPMTPERNFKLTAHIAKYHAAAFNERNELYYSEQSFDDFYYGKGSTYPDIQGAIGILFEQASSRGHLKQRSYGPLPFAHTIRNQVTASFSTLKAGLEMRQELLEYQRAFFKGVQNDSHKDKIKAYAFGDDNDPVTTYEMAKMLRRHNIKLYKQARAITLDNKTIRNGYIIPLDQPQYRLIKSLFEPMLNFPDQTFYDVSTWHLPSAFNMPYVTLDSRNYSRGVHGQEVESPVFPSVNWSAETGQYAYLIEWQSFYAPRAAYALLNKGIKVRYAQRTFGIRSEDRYRKFERGTLMIPMGIQTISETEIQAELQRIAKEDGVAIHGVKSGLTSEGIDFGSPSFTELKKPKVAILTGLPMSATEVGEIWYLLDNQMDIPLTMLENKYIDKMDLDAYTHLIVVSGKLNLSNAAAEKMSDWISAGGTLMTLRAGYKLVENQKWAKVQTKKDKENNTTSMPFAERSAIMAKSLISGAVFKVNLDLTHPLCYGLNRDQINMFRSGTHFVELLEDPFVNVGRYTSAPLVSGYVSSENLDLMANTLAISATPMKKGVVIMMMDNPNFRDYWKGSNRLFLNGLFFSSAMTR